MANEIPIEFKDNSNFLSKIEKLKANGLDITINLNIKSISGLKKDITDQLNEKGITLNKLSITKGAINELLSDIEEGLASKAISLGTFDLESGTTSRLRNLIEEELNEKPMTLESFEVKVDSSLRKEIEAELNAKAIKLNSFEAEKSSIDALRNQISDILNRKPIKLTNFLATKSSLKGVKKTIEDALQDVKISVKAQTSASKSLTRDQAAKALGPLTYKELTADGVPRHSISGVRGPLRRTLSPLTYDKLVGKDVLGPLTYNQLGPHFGRSLNQSGNYNTTFSQQRVTGGISAADLHRYKIQNEIENRRNGIGPSANLINLRQTLLGDLDPRVDEYRQLIAPRSGIKDNFNKIASQNKAGLSFQQSFAPKSDINQERNRQLRIDEYITKNAPKSLLDEHRKERAAFIEADLKYQQAIASSSDINQEKNREASIDALRIKNAPKSNLKERLDKIASQNAAGVKFNQVLAPSSDINQEKNRQFRIDEFHINTAAKSSIEDHRKARAAYIAGDLKYQQAIAPKSGIHDQRDRDEAEFHAQSAAAAAIVERERLRQDAIDKKIIASAPKSDIAAHQKEEAARIESIKKYNESKAPKSDPNFIKDEEERLFHAGIKAREDAEAHLREQERKRQEADLKYQQAIAPKSDINQFRDEAEREFHAQSEVARKQREAAAEHQRLQQEAIDNLHKKNAPFSGINDEKDRLEREFHAESEKRRLQQEAADNFHKANAPSSNPNAQNIAREKLQREVDERGFIGVFDHDSFVARRAQELGLHDTSSIKKRALYDRSRVDQDPFTKLQINRDSFDSLINQGPLQAFGSFVGGNIGGGLDGQNGAAVGAGLGNAAANIAVASFEKIKETLLEAAQAGFAFQRSIIAISGSLLQNSYVVDKNGQPLSEVEQLKVQRARATAIQQSSRTAAAQVGIGGEAESNLVQSILTGAGSKGIDLDPEQVAKLTSRFGAAINLFAPDIKNNPGLIRRDISDILSGSGVASRTVLGSRLGSTLNSIKTASSGDELIRATESLDKLILAFRNSGDAVTQMELMSAQVEKLRQDFGKGLIDQITPSLQEINRVLSDEQIASKLVSFAEAIGAVGNALLGLGSGFLEGIVNGKSSSDSKNGTVKAASEFGAFSANAIIKGNPYLSQLSTIFGYIGLGANNDIIDSIGEDERQQIVERKIKAEQEKHIKPNAQNIINTALLEATGNKDVPTLVELARGTAESDLFQGSKILQNIKNLDNGREFDNTLAGTGLLTKGIQGIRADNTALAGTSIGGTIKGLESQFSGIGSFNSEASVQKLEIETLKQSLSGIDSNKNPKEYAQTAGLLTQAEIKLQKVRDNALTSAINLGDSEKRLADLRAQGIDRTSFEGQADFTQATIDALDASISGRRKGYDSLDEAGKTQSNLLDAADRARQNEAIAQQKIDPYQRLGRVNDLEKQLVEITAQFSTMGDRFKSLNSSIAETTISITEFGNSAALASLEGQDKVIASLKDYQSKGGTLDLETYDRISKLYGSDAASGIFTDSAFGDGLSTEFRDRNKSGRRLQQTLSEQEKLPYQQDQEIAGLRTKRTNLEAERANFGRNELANRIQQTTALTQLSQLFSGEKNNPFEAAASQSASILSNYFDEKGNPKSNVSPSLSGTPGLKLGDPNKAMRQFNEDVAKLTTSLTTLVTALQVENFARSIARAIKIEMGSPK